VRKPELTHAGRSPACAGRVDLLAGLTAIAVDEVKYKKGQKYLTVVCSHTTGRVIWAAKGRSKDTLI